MKWTSRDLSFQESFSDWRGWFCWYPVFIKTGEVEHGFWLCRIERRKRKWRGKLFTDDIFSEWQYREPINHSKDEATK